MPTTDVNDTDFTYTGSWGYGGGVPSWQSDEHFSVGTGNTYSLTATGTRFRVFSMKHPNYGIMAVSVDGGPETDVDCYAPARVASAQLWESPVLPRGSHTVRVRVTGRKNPSAAYAYVSADRIQVEDTSEPPPPPPPNNAALVAKLDEATAALATAETELVAGAAAVGRASTELATATSRLNATQAKVDETQARLAELRTALGSGGGGTPNPSVGGLFILHEQAPPSPTWVAQNASTYDALPFDGVSLVGDWSDQTLRSTALNESAVRTELSVIGSASLNRCKHNWALVYATPFGTFDQWQTPATNFGKLAAVIKDTPNVVGIKFDIEEYFGETWHDTAAGNSPNPRASAHTAGKGIMAEMIRRNPNIRIMTTFGAWVSSTEAHQDANANGLALNDVAWANQYQGNFIAGMVEATAGTGAVYIDGGELYYVPNQTIRRWWMNYVKTTFPDRAPYIVVPSVRTHWSSRYKMGWGTYDWPGDTSEMWTDRGTWTTAMLRQDNIDALATDDPEAITWFYTERWRFANNPRSGKPAPPADAMQALRDAYATKTQ
jgi:hypothetical protein